MIKQTIIIDGVSRNVPRYLLAKDSDGREYDSDCYLEADASGMYMPNMIEVSKREVENIISNFTAITDNFIQYKVVAYNKANGTDFASILSFPKYAVVPTDSRNAISLQFLAWNGKIWDAVNTIRTTAITTGVVPTEAEFLAVLESVVF